MHRLLILAIALSGCAGWSLRGEPLVSDEDAQRIARREIRHARLAEKQAAKAPQDAREAWHFAILCPGGIYAEAVSGKAPRQNGRQWSISEGGRWITIDQPAGCGLAIVEPASASVPDGFAFHPEREQIPISAATPPAGKAE